MNNFKFIALVALLVSLAASLAACGGSPDGGAESLDQAATAPDTTKLGFECGAVYTGQYMSVTYGIYDELETACLKLKGQCLPEAKPGVAANMQRVFCVAAP